jgi:acyl-CoA synthetase (AMP-forming)/AMP-acid ligase II
VDFNIATALSRMAESAPYQKAVIFPENRDRQGRVAYTQLTYAQLEEASQIVARGLLAHGIGYGIRVAFLVKPSLEFFILTFALFKAKAIPVFIDPGLGLKAMRRCLREAKAEAFIGSPLAHLARILFGWRGAGWKKKFLISHLPWPGTINFVELKQAGERLAKVSLPMAEPNELAAILFTSGSTGAPKGAMYTHGNFHAQVRLLKESLEIRPGEIDLSTFPLFCLLGPALGITAVIPEMNFTRPAKVDPEKIAEAIRNFGVTTMFGSPALIKTVAQYGATKNWQFPSLHRVISAGAPVPASVISQFRRMLEKSARFYTPYGATEALPIAVAESETILGQTAAMTEQGHGICVGTVTPGSDVRIIWVKLNRRR